MTKIYYTMKEVKANIETVISTMSKVAIEETEYIYFWREYYLNKAVDLLFKHNEEEVLARIEHIRFEVAYGKYADKESYIDNFGMNLVIHWVASKPFPKFKMRKKTYMFVTVGNNYVQKI